MCETQTGVRRPGFAPLAGVFVWQLGVGTEPEMCIEVGPDISPLPTSKTSICLQGALADSFLAMARRQLTQPQKLSVNMSAELGRLGKNYAQKWELWAKEVDAWPDSAAKKDPAAYLDLIYNTIAMGRIAFMAGGASREIDKLRRRLEKKCRRWELIARDAGYRVSELF